MDDRLRALAKLQEFEFRSSVPVIGGLFTAFRRAWHAVAGRWALRSLAQQQTAYNRAAADALALHGKQLDAALAALAELQRTDHSLAAEMASAQLAQRRNMQALAASLADARAEAQSAAAALATLRQAHDRAPEQPTQTDGRPQMLDAPAEAQARATQRLADVTSAYLAEAGHEIAQLAIALRELSERVDALARAADGPRSD